MCIIGKTIAARIGLKCYDLYYAWKAKFPLSIIVWKGEIRSACIQRGILYEVIHRHTLGNTSKVEMVTSVELYRVCDTRVPSY